MRITIIGPVYPYRGGIAHYTTTLAQKLSSAGHAVQTVSFKRQYPAWLYPGESDKDPSTLHSQVPALYTLDPLYFWTWVRAARQIQAFQPDLVIFQWWTTFWAPAFAVLAHFLRARGFRIVFLIHNVMPHETRFWDRWLARLVLGAGEQHIAQAEREATRLRSLLPEARVTITPLPVYNMLSSDTISPELARSTLGLPAETPIVLFFGIVRPYKGLRYLLEAFAILKAKNVQAQLVIAGEFWEPISEYQQMIARLEIADRVHVHNRYIPNEEIGTFFRAANLFAAPYVDGTQSASAKLALGFGLPMVLTRCIVDQTLAAQEDIWLAEERDAGSLAAAIAAALEQVPGNRPSRQVLNDWHTIVQVIEELSGSAVRSGCG